MMRPFVAHVPDTLWKQLGTTIHHFRYHEPDKDHSVAVYADGREEIFDSRVTPELEEEHRHLWRAALERSGYSVLWSGTIKIEKPKVHRQIYGFTSD